MNSEIKLSSYLSLADIIIIVSLSLSLYLSTSSAYRYGTSRQNEGKSRGKRKKIERRGIALAMQRKQPFWGGPVWRYVLSDKMAADVSLFSPFTLFRPFFFPSSASSQLSFFFFLCTLNLSSSFTL